LRLWRRAAPFLTLGITAFLSWTCQSFLLRQPIEAGKQACFGYNLFTQQFFNRFTDFPADNRRAADSPSAFGVFGTHKMAAAGFFSFNLTAAGDFYSLR
jgi:hypothetical protein